MTEQLRILPMVAMAALVALFVGYACISSAPRAEYIEFPPMLVEVTNE